MRSIRVQLERPEHENNFGNELERLQEWRSALFEVAGMSGKPYETNNGAGLKNDVEDVFLSSPVETMYHVNNGAVVTGE
ncbi:hypothetical protein L195_g033556 [Trifolium pratense]|uniref:Uncharacterized protein n=1 Tax=Trifolium pratense TaxID=57577 RepID=A0A2K3LGD2_TRIPR|nr:hypothetical protein L195_g033556 [Trifolium pratense]